MDTDSNIADNRIIVTSGLGGLLLSLFMWKKHKKKIPTFFITPQKQNNIFHLHHRQFFHKDIFDICEIENNDIPQNDFHFSDNDKTVIRNLPALKLLHDLVRKIIRQSHIEKITPQKKELWCVFKMAEYLVQPEYKNIQEIIKKLHQLSLKDFLDSTTDDEDIKRALLFHARSWPQTNTTQKGSAIALMRTDILGENTIPIHGDCTDFVTLLCDKIRAFLGADFIVVSNDEFHILTDEDSVKIRVGATDYSAQKILCDMPPLSLLEKLLINPAPNLNLIQKTKFEKSSDRSFTIRIEARIADQKTDEKQHIVFCPDTDYLSKAHQDFHSQYFSNAPLLSLIQNNGQLSIEAQFYDSADMTADKIETIKQTILSRAANLLDINIEQFFDVVFFEPLRRDSVFGSSHLYAFDHLMPIGHVLHSPFILDTAPVGLHQHIQMIGLGQDAHYPPIADIPFILAQK